MTVLATIMVKIDGEEVYFHREMDLPFLPIYEMRFDFRLMGQSSDMKYHRFATFVVANHPCWIERSATVEIYLEVAEDEEETIGRADLDTLIWKEGEKDPWLW